MQCENAKELLQMALIRVLNLDTKKDDVPSE